MFSVTRVGELIARIYETGIDRRDWPVLAEELGRFFAAPFGAISVRRPDGSLSVRTSFGIPAKFSESYERHFWAVDVIFRRLRAAPRETLVLANLGGDPEVRQTEFFNDYLKPLGCSHVIGGMTGQGEDELVTVGFGRVAGERPFDAADGRMLRMLTSHFRRAVELGRRAGTGRDAAGLSLLDQLGQGVLLLDSTGVVVFNNAAAKPFVEGREVGVRAGRLWAQRPADAAAIARAVAAATASEQSGAHTVRISRDGHPPLELVVMPIGQSGGFAATDRRAAAAVLISDPQQQVCPAEAAGPRYGLTRQETRIAAVLVRGGTLAEAASELGIGRETARFHLKNIFQKTNTHRQAELGRLLLTSAQAPLYH